MSQGLSYRILEPVWLNEQGIRDYSEDYIYPDQKTGINDRVRQFLVCDGVGGSTRGDQASKFVCGTFPVKVGDKLEQAIDSDFILQNQERLLNKALYEVEMDMDAFAEQHPEYRGMATTLTYLNLSKNGAVVAWAGDSRVYQIRNGQVKQRTADHSLVNELVKRGEITEEQARNHPRKNVILRAISGSGNSTRLDVEIWQDIQKGDVFFLCTDGILEAFESDHQLAELLSSGMTLDKIRDRIDALCKEHSRDNYSMYLIKVQEVEGQPLIPIQAKGKQAATAGTTTMIAGPATKSATAPVEIEEEAFEDVRHDAGKHTSTLPPKPEKEGGIPKRYLILGGLFGILLILSAIYLYLRLVNRGPSEASLRQKSFFEEFDGKHSTASTLQDQLDVYSWAVSNIEGDSILRKPLNDTLSHFREQANDLRDRVANLRTELDTLNILVKKHDEAIASFSEVNEQEVVQRHQDERNSKISTIVEICRDLNNKPPLCKVYTPASNDEKGSLNETPDMKAPEEENGETRPAAQGRIGQNGGPQSVEETPTAVPQGGAQPAGGVNFSHPSWEKYDYYSQPVEGMVLVRKGDKWGVVNTELRDDAGNYREIMSPTSSYAFEAVEDYHHGFAAVQRDGTWGYINKFGDPLIKQSGNPLPFTKIEAKFGNQCPGYGLVEIGADKFFLQKISYKEGKLIPNKENTNCPD